MIAMRAEHEQAEHQHRAATAGSPWPRSAPAACSATTAPTAPRRPRGAAFGRRRRPCRRAGCRPASPGRRSCASEEPRRGECYGRATVVRGGGDVVGSVPPRCGCSCWTTTTASCSTSCSTSASSAPIRSSTATTPSTSPTAVALEPDGVLHLARPGRPEDAGIICDAVAAFAERGTPVFGVCLGQQAIGHVYGGVDRRRRPS